MNTKINIVLDCSGSMSVNCEQEDIYNLLKELVAFPRTFFYIQTKLGIDFLEPGKHVEFDFYGSTPPTWIEGFLKYNLEEEASNNPPRPPITIIISDGKFDSPFINAWTRAIQGKKVLKQMHFIFIAVGDGAALDELMVLCQFSASQPIFFNYKELDKDFKKIYDVVKQKINMELDCYNIEDINSPFLFSTQRILPCGVPISLNLPRSLDPEAYNFLLSQLQVMVQIKDDRRFKCLNQLMKIPLSPFRHKLINIVQNVSTFQAGEATKIVNYMKRDTITASDITKHAEARKQHDGMRNVIDWDPLWVSHKEYPDIKYRIVVYEDKELTLPLYSSLDNEELVVTADQLDKCFYTIEVYSRQHRAMLLSIDIDNVVKHVGLEHGSGIIDGLKDTRFMLTRPRVCDANGNSVLRAAIKFQLTYMNKYEYTRGQTNQGHSSKNFTTPIKQGGRSFPYHPTKSIFSKDYKFGVSTYFSTKSCTDQVDLNNEIRFSKPAFNEAQDTKDEIDQQSKVLRFASFSKPAFNEAQDTKDEIDQQSNVLRSFASKPQAFAYSVSSQGIAERRLPIRKAKVDSELIRDKKQLEMGNVNKEPINFSWTHPISLCAYFVGTVEEVIVKRVRKFIEKECIFCLDEVPQFGYDNCNHILCCYECSTNPYIPNICPMCRTEGKIVNVDSLQSNMDVSN